MRYAARAMRHATHTRQRAVHSATDKGLAGSSRVYAEEQGNRAMTAIARMPIAYLQGKGRRAGGVGRAVRQGGIQPGCESMARGKPTKTCLELDVVVIFAFRLQPRPQPHVDRRKSLRPKPPQVGVRCAVMGVSIGRRSFDMAVPMRVWAGGEARPSVALLECRKPTTARGGAGAPKGGDMFESVAH